MLTASRTTHNDLPASENQEGDFLLGWNINEAVELLGFVFRTFKTECDGESFQVDLTAEILHEHRGHLPGFGLGGVDADLIENLLESTEGFCLQLFSLSATYLECACTIDSLGRSVLFQTDSNHTSTVKISVNDLTEMVFQLGY
jgi:hypothetical protein